MNITTLDQAQQELLRYVPAVKAFTGKDITLKRIMPILQHLGNPQDSLKVIHVAGTSGKTSTCYFTAALLLQSGYSVGLTVSPHIDKVTERIQINGAPISDKLFCKYLGECIDLISDLPVQPSYFELLIALSFWIFTCEGVDIAVIETGMGGLHDGTNVASRPDKVCVITDIGFDHMHILGDTLAKIAGQKAGIIYAGNSVFTYKQPHDVMLALREQSERVDATMYVASATVPAHLHNAVILLPAFQKRNFMLALQVVEYVLHRHKKPMLTNQQVITATKTYVPARMDTVRIGAKTLVMDGAHNGQKMKTFVDSFIDIYGSKKAAVLLALKQGKEYTEVLEHLHPITSQLIITTFHTSQDLPAHAMDPHVLAEHARQAGIANVSVITNNHKAYQHLLTLPYDTLIITGSFYMIGQVRDSEHLQHDY